MEISSEYAYTIEVYDPSNGDTLDQGPVGSLMKYGEHTFFEGLCKGQILPCTYGSVSKAYAEPVWPRKHSKPYMSGMAITIDVDGNGQTFSKVFTLTAFYSKAQRIGRLLMERGLLADNTPIYYRIAAYPKSRDTISTGNTRSSHFSAKVTNGRGDLVLKQPEESFKSITPSSCELFDVYILKSTLDSLIRKTEKAGRYENASFLVGYLGYALDSKRVYLAIVDEIPAQAGGESTSTSFTFSSETFAAAQKALLLQRNDQRLHIVGWEHNHSFSLNSGQVSQPATTTAFWSQDDDLVQESAFPEPHQVALVIGLKTTSSATVKKQPYDIKLYGWRDAIIRERNFSILKQRV